MAKYEVLDAFYKSPEWVKFRKHYIFTRARADKGWKCDYCGEWIEKADDITLHHCNIELTPDNYKDAMIALNPSNIQQVHRACHNKIHCHAGDRSTRVHIIYGPPCGGKNTYVLQRAWRGDIIIDMDSLYEAVSGRDRYDKPDTLLMNVISMRNLLIDQIKTRYGRWDNAWIIGGYADHYQRDKLAKELGAEVIHVKATKEDCYQRLNSDKARSQREAEWKKYIDKWFDEFTE